MRRRAGGAALVATWLAAACGEARGPTAIGRSPAMAAAPATLAFVAEAGGPDPAPQLVAISGEGEGTLARPVVGVASAGIATWLSAAVSGDAPSFTVTATASTGGLDVGTYGGIVTVACAGAPNSPLEVPVSLVVKNRTPVMEVAPASLRFTMQQGGAAPAPAPLEVRGRDGAAIARPTVQVRAEGGSDWLEATAAAAAAPYTVTVTVLPGSLGPGRYAGAVAVASRGAAGSPVEVPVELEVAAPPPVLEVAPSSVAFRAVVGGPPPGSLALRVSGRGGAALSTPTAEVRFAGAGGWLSVTVGESAGAYAITVTADPGTLGAGTYAATVVVAAEGAVGSPVEIPVTLSLETPPPWVPPVLVVVPPSLEFAAIAGGPAPSTQRLQVSSANGTALTMPSAVVEYADGAGWLQVDALASVGSYVFVVVPSTGGLPAGRYGAQVVVSSPGASNTPVRVPVLLTLSAPGPGAIAAVSRVSQVGRAGLPVADTPAVIVTDSWGAPRAGTTVTFSVVEGGGSLTGASAISGADGVARVGSWTLGAAGLQRVEAAAAGLGGSPVAFQATIGSGTYGITLRFLTSATDAQRAALQAARERIERVVQGDLPDVPLRLTAGEMIACGGGPAIDETVDDLLILVTLTSIDGPGGILGRAASCILREGSLLPVLGFMQFDTADLASLEADGTLEPVVVHEMLHVVGFGTIWTDVTPSLLSGAGGSDPVFLGIQARNAFLDFNGGGSYLGTPVPVENTGGGGTRDSHWRESVFKNELMTGWISGATQPFSWTTAASLVDLGYIVDPSAADPFDIATAGLLAPFAGAAGREAVLVEDVVRVPLRVVDRAGRVRPK